jgi:hypothetical protein
VPKFRRDCNRPDDGETAGGGDALLWAPVRYVFRVGRHERSEARHARALRCHPPVPLRPGGGCPGPGLWRTPCHGRVALRYAQGNLRGHWSARRTPSAAFLASDVRRPTSDRVKRLRFAALRATYNISSGSTSRCQRQRRASGSCSRAVRRRDRVRCSGRRWGASSINCWR